MITKNPLSAREPDLQGVVMPGSPDQSQVFEQAIQDHLAVIESVRSQQPVLDQIAAQMTRAVIGGNKVLWCGNGGSAADAQHLAAELVGRFRRERRGLASVALTTDTSILTSIGNDYGFEQIFRRQVEALCAEGDVVVGISTSGNSRNVCLALDAARNLGAFTVAFTGQGGGAMAGVTDALLSISSKDTARIQEAHILCGHILCDWIELSVCGRKPEQDTVTR
jgi:D-sedoheptulose 7-phosphate isomerase